MSTVRDEADRLATHIDHLIVTRTGPEVDEAARRTVERHLSGADAQLVLEMLFGQTLVRKRKQKQYRTRKGADTVTGE